MLDRDFLISQPHPTLPVGTQTLATASPDSPQTLPSSAVNTPGQLLLSVSTSASPYCRPQSLKTVFRSRPGETLEKNEDCVAGVLRNRRPVLEAWRAV